MFVVRLRVLSDPKKLDPAVRMMLDVFKNASFQHKSLDLAISNVQIGQKQIEENPSRLMEHRLYRTLYAQHPYAQPITGTLGGTKKFLLNY